MSAEPIAAAEALGLVEQAAEMLESGEICGILNHMESALDLVLAGRFLQ